ncbi:MAG: tetratricopeptide repeat protein [Bacteroidia bacterium]
MIRKTLFILLLLQASLFCAQVKVKELRGKLKQCTNDTCIATAYYDLSTAYRDINVDTALLYADSMSAKALSVKNEHMITLSIILRSQAYTERGDFEQSSRLLFQALKRVEKTKDIKLECIILNSLGQAYAQQNRHDEALNFFLSSLKLFDTIKEYKNYCVVNMNIGNTYYAKGYLSNDFSMAYKYYNKALAIAEKHGLYDQEITTMSNMALAYADDQQPLKSIEILNKAMKLVEQHHMETEKVYILYYLGRAYGYLKEYDKSFAYLNESLKLARNYGNYDHEADCYLEMSDVYSSKKDFANAYKYLGKYNALHDSLNNQATQEQLSEIQTQYETHKKQQQLELSNQKLQTQEEKLEKQQTVIFSVIGGALLLLILLFVFYSRYQLKQKANRKLEGAYATIEEKNKNITDSINYARRIQQAMLPEEETFSRLGSETFVLFKPRDIVSGDFYWTSEHDGIKFLAVADCTGHGVPGALMSMIGNSLLNQVVNENSIIHPSDILEELRSGIISALKQGSGENSSQDGMDISIIVLHSRTNMVEYAGANNPLWIIRNNEFREIKADKQPIGIYTGVHLPFTNHKFKAEPGDTLYLFTDGFADQFGGDKIKRSDGTLGQGKKFKYKNLQQTLLRLNQLPLSEQKEQLDHIFEEWKGGYEQVDDVLLAGIRI